ncbi:MAG: 4'-phosphopantetheinyl transferase superfamily protein [Pyrinomonadaceae bacterium]|nr:4'-phosphopantetheinyl transferase superfamily protein [Pyrinomonadaceae bacterium]
MSFKNNSERSWADIKNNIHQSNVVHLWIADLKTFDLGKISNLLSVEELTKGDKFYFAKDRKTYLASRGLLRFLLGKYTAVSACEITFDYNRFGKPGLAFPLSGEIFFNISHSGDFCLLSFSYSHQIGIDVELIKPVDYELLAKNIFSINEQAEFESVSADLKAKSFFCGWTRKESFIKGIGEGLSFPLKNFSVVLNPKIPVSKVEIHSENSPDYENWQTFDISFDTQYCAALAVKNPDTFAFEKFYIDDYSQMF